MYKYKFSILITTKNRLEDLKYTLQKITHLIENSSVETIICDDGSTDGTFEYINKNYPNIQLIQNKKSKGLIFSRNRLLNMTKAKYAISLDDDLNFLINNPLEIIEEYFDKNETCAVISFRIFWGKKLPTSFNCVDKNLQTKSYAGGAHVFRMKAWKSIPNYPDWFVFYGEEDFAAFQLFKKGWEIHYVPSILVHHRVNIKSRKKDKDYMQRSRRSLRAGWYLYFLFYPLKEIPRRFLYTLWMQLKLKVFKGDFKALMAILQALFDVLISIPRLIKHSNRLTVKEFNRFQKLEDAKIYWKPKEK